MSSSLEYYIPGYSDTIYPMIVGLVLAAGTAFVIFGGVHRIGFITSVLVPIMAGTYLLIGLVTILMNLTELPHVFSMILSQAFDLQAFAGGMAGSAVVIGIKRGLFLMKRVWEVRPMLLRARLSAIRRNREWCRFCLFSLIHC